MAQYSSAPYSGDLALFALNSEQVYVHGQMHLGSNSTFLDTGYASIANASISSLVGTSASISVGTIATLASDYGVVNTLSVPNQVLISGLATFAATGTLNLATLSFGGALPRAANDSGVAVGQLWIDSADESIKVKPAP